MGEGEELRTGGKSEGGAKEGIHWWGWLVATHTHGRSVGIGRAAL